jgi:prevent-host-death family protein
MRSIGIRELRQHASRYLRMVAEGETLQISDRGHPVALLTPIPSGSTLASMVETGRATAAAGDLLELGAPLRPTPNVELPSLALSKSRDDER